MTRLLVIAALAACLFFGWKHFTNPARAPSVAAGSVEELSALAATVKPGEVVMYSTTECTYCAQAKGWLNQYGFAFTECNMSVDKSCEQQFKAYGAEKIRVRDIYFSS